MVQETSTDRRSFLKYAGTAAAAATVSMAGCVGDDDDEEAEELEHVTITQGAFPETLDPIGDNSTPTYNVIDQAYEPFLYRSRDDGETIARVCDEWERIDDNTVELTVRDGATFHSGNDCTAEDVAHSINRANGNFEEWESDVAAVIGDIDEAEAVDEDTVRVHLNAVVPVIFRNLGAFGRVTEKEWVEDPEVTVSEDINGTGPYELVDHEDEEFVEYERFDDFWGDEPAVQGARINGRTEDGARVDDLMAGETDIISAVPPDRMTDIQGEDGLVAESVPSIRTIFLVMNTLHEPFGDADFRRAMNYAVDTDSVIESQLEGFGARTSQPTLEGHTGHAPDLDPYPHDPEQAEELVDESGFAGVDITIDVPEGRYVGGVDVAESYAGQIDDLDNVSCDFERRDFGTLVGEIFAPEQEAAPPFFLIGWGVPTLDADYAMGDWFKEEGASRMANDEEIQNLLRDADNETDLDAREGILQDANRRAHNQAFWVFSHQQFSLYGMDERIDWDPREDEDILVEEMAGN